MTAPMTADEAKSRLAALCSRGERCPEQVRRKLAAWGVADGEQVVDWLREHGYVDEARFARCYARDKLRHQGWGKVKIAMGLRALRIPGTLIDAALAELPDEECADKLAAILRRKLRTTRAANAWELRQKLLRYAAGRGFRVSEEVLAEVLSE